MRVNIHKVQGSQINAKVSHKYNWNLRQMKKQQCYSDNGSHTTGLQKSDVKTFLFFCAMMCLKFMPVFQ